MVMSQGSGEGTDKEYYGEENLVIVAAELGQGRERHIHRNKSLYIGCFLLDGLLRGFMLHAAQLSLLAEGFPDRSLVYFFRSEHTAKRVISGFLFFLGDDFLDFRFDIDIGITGGDGDVQPEDVIVGPNMIAQFVQLRIQVFSNAEYEYPEKNDKNR
ncbi:MAG: hypothetical protein SV765_06305 [Pseudomonadota bacterium]|nr:hypothetical protein [Pseudomonadota bacterium]